MWLWLGQGAEKQLVQVRATASRIAPTVVKALVPMPSPGRILDWHALGALSRTIDTLTNGTELLVVGKQEGSQRYRKRTNN